jgi:hypothetical protein
MKERMISDEEPDYAAEFLSGALACSTPDYSVELSEISYDDMPARVKRLIRSAREAAVSGSDCVACDGYKQLVISNSKNRSSDFGWPLLNNAHDGVSAYARVVDSSMKGVPKKVFLVGLYNGIPGEEGKSPYKVFLERVDDGTEETTITKMVTVKPRTAAPGTGQSNTEQPELDTKPLEMQSAAMIMKGLLHRINEYAGSVESI